MKAALLFFLTMNSQKFELINLPVPCVFILQDGTRCDLRGGFPSTTLKAYKEGLWCLGLKPGAEEFLKRESNEEIIRLIKTAKRAKDVEILALAKPKNKTVKKAAEEKLSQFNNQTT